MAAATFILPESMPELISNSPEETRAVGRTWASGAKPGWVIGLSGDLGAGKTQLVKGLAEGLGVTQRVSSPSFALLNDYSGGRMPLAHIDLYRLETREQIIGAGLEEYLYRPHGIAVIEWFERWLGADEIRAKDISGNAPKPPARFRFVQIEAVSETARRITYEDFGD